MSLVTTRKGYKSVPWLFGKEIEIPEEWEVKTISELGKIVTGSTPDTTNKKYFDNDFLWASPIDFEGEKYITQTNSMLSEKGLSISRKIPKDSVLVVCIGSTIGKIGMASVEMSTNQQINSIICNNDNSNFIYYQLQQNNYLIKNRSNQSAVPIINKTEFGKFKLILPNEISEQQKIATILSNVDNLIESTGKVIKNSKLLKKGLMQELLTRGIGHTKFKKVPWLFGQKIEIPEEWNISRLNDVCVKITDGEHIKPTYTQKGIPFLTAKNIQNNGINFDEINYISKEDGTKSRKRCNPEHNDVLIVSRGATIGRTCIINFHDEFCLLGSVILIKSGKNLVSSFLSNLLKSNLIQKRIIGISNSTAQDAIYLKDIQKIRINVPTVEEQQKIATILSNIDSKITLQEQYKEKLEKLKKSLMQKLLTGEVRV